MIFSAHDARTGETLGTYSDATVAEIDRAVRAAAEAAPAFASITPAARAKFLECIAEELIAAGPALLELAHRETALPLARLESERARTVGQLRLFAALVREGSWVDARIDHAQPQQQPIPRPDIRRMLQPLGPIAVFGASNFPLAFSVVGGDTASALAAGNPVVIKAHPAHPGTSGISAEAIRRALVKCDLPAGTVGFLHGASPEVSLALVRHPLIAAVAFTGSARAGRALFDEAGTRPRPIPVFSEMSSCNPVFMLPDAVRERAPLLAEGLAASFTLGVGQFCTKPGMVFGVASSAWELFCNALGIRAQAQSAGVMLHQGIADAFSKGISALSEIEWLARGPAYVARIRAGELLARPELAKELFGPFILAVTAENISQLNMLAESLEGQLTATLHGTPEDFENTAGLIAILERRAGRLVCNGFPTGVEVCASMHHGGPYPATTDARFTSVGTAAILRFARPVCYQGFPDARLPRALQSANPLGLLRLVDGEHTRTVLG